MSRKVLVRSKSRMKSYIPWNLVLCGCLPLSLCACMCVWLTFLCPPKETRTTGWVGFKFWVRPQSKQQKSWPSWSGGGAKPEQLTEKWRTNDQLCSPKNKASRTVLCSLKPEALKLLLSQITHRSPRMSNTGQVDITLTSSPLTSSPLSSSPHPTDNEIFTGNLKT